MKLQNNIFNNKQTAYNILNAMSTNALQSLAKDLKTQVEIGLMSDSEASDKRNLITTIILKREEENAFSN